MVAVMADDTRTERLHPAVRKYLEVELSTYPATKRAIEERRQDIIFGSRGQALDEQVIIKRVKGAHSDPTAFRGSLLHDDARLRQLERMADAIDEVMAVLQPQQQQLIRLYYFGDLNANLAQIAARIGVSEPTARRWCNQMRFGLACRLGMA